MKSPKLESFLNTALDKMFKSVGFEHFDKDFTSQESWYTLRSWSEEDCDKFKDWFVQEAKKSLKWSKKTAEREFSYFNLMWGWTVTPETSTLTKP
jgi:hypothetical protein